MTAEKSSINAKMKTLDEPSQGAKAFRIRPLIALTIFAISGALLATWPHWVWQIVDGNPIYFADRDEWLYLAWSRGIVLRGDLHLSDAVHSESGPMMHSWLLFVPISLLAHGLSLNMEHVGILWRATAGAGMALGFVAALRGSSASRLTIIGVAAFLMFDPGVSFGQLLYRDGVLLKRCVNQDGGPFPGTPDFLNHLRVPSPGLAIPFYLLFLGLLTVTRAQSQPKPSKPQTIGAGLALGILFYLYFYFWTVAVLGLAAAFLLDRGRRQTHAAILTIGTMIGLPALWSNARLKASTLPDWLTRTEKFVPIGHFDELLAPTVLIASWLVAGWIVWRHRHDLRGIWCVAGAGIACLNHQIVTGLQIENFHWHQPAGLALSVLWGRLGANWCGQTRKRQWILGVAVALQVALGFGFRTIEALRTEESLECRALAQSLPLDSWKIPPGSAVGGDIRLQTAAVALRDCRALNGRLVDFSSKTSNAELDQRLVLGLWMQGLTKKRAIDLLARPEGLGGWFEAYPRRPQGRKERVERRLALAEHIWSDPAKWVLKFQVDYAILDAHQTSPLINSAYATILDANRDVTIWRIRAMEHP